MNTKLLSWVPKALFIALMVFLITLFGSQTARAAGMCYVNASAGGANNGASWADAYTDLQSALGEPTCTEVWVAAGTYKPTGVADRAISFTLKNGVALYGGFVGTETARAERDPAANLTILSGDIGTTGDIADNSYHVVVGGDTNATAVLDGFTITAGNANGSYPANAGGGMWNYSGSPTLTNLIFNSNSASYGGGMANTGDPALTNVTFSGNSSGYERGGGMYNEGGNPTLTNVTFSDNSDSGMYNWYGSPTLTNVTFSGNSWFGMYNHFGSPTLTNVTFSGNSGPGMDNWYGSFSLTNVTFSGNLFGMFNSRSGGNISDSIFWGNSRAEIHNEEGFSSLADSVVAGGCPSRAACSNVLTSDPLLGPLANNGGFTQTMALGAGSSAIDTGNDVTCASTDQRSVTRPQGAHCDIGAYEWVGHTISGNAGVAGATLSYTDGLPQTAIADGSGNYTLEVTPGWSGTVTPSKDLMTFTPPSRSYTNVTANQTGQNFTPDQTIRAISGNAGMSGVKLSLNNGTPPAISDSSGNYTLLLPDNWSGTVTPSKTGFNYIFTPPSRSYTNLSADQTAQDYTPTVYKVYIPLVAR